MVDAYLLYSSGSDCTCVLAILKGLLGRERAAAMMTASEDRPTATPNDTKRPNIRSTGRRPAICREEEEEEGRTVREREREAHVHIEMDRRYWSDMA